MRAQPIGGSPCARAGQIRSGFGRKLGRFGWPGLAKGTPARAHKKGDRSGSQLRANAVDGTGSVSAANYEHTDNLLRTAPEP